MSEQPTPKGRGRGSNKATRAAAGVAGALAFLGIGWAMGARSATIAAAGHNDRQRAHHRRPHVPHGALPGRVGRRGRGPVGNDPSARHGVARATRHRRCGPADHRFRREQRSVARASRHEHERDGAADARHDSGAARHDRAPAPPPRGRPSAEAHAPSLSILGVRRHRLRRSRSPPAPRPRSGPSPPRKERPPLADIATVRKPSRPPATTRSTVTGGDDYPCELTRPSVRWAPTPT